MQLWPRVAFTSWKRWINEIFILLLEKFNLLYGGFSYLFSTFWMWKTEMITGPCAIQPQLRQWARAWHTSRSAALPRCSITIFLKRTRRLIEYFQPLFDAEFFSKIFWIFLYIGDKFSKPWGSDKPISGFSLPPGDERIRFWKTWSLRSAYQTWISAWKWRPVDTAVPTGNCES